MRIGYRLHSKVAGFTLMELMVTMAIMGLLVTMATPVSFFQQTQSIDYANTAMEQAKSYTNMINDHYIQYYNNAKNGLVSVPYSTVISGGYNGAVSITDRYGAIPCATLSYSTQTKKLSMFMYYAGGSGVQADIVSGANKYLNGIAGQLVNGTYQGAFNSWSISSAHIVGSCGAPVANSLAMNLNLLTTHVGNTNNDSSLHRTLDASGPVAGTLANANTLRTDIIMGYKQSPDASAIYSGIYFTENKNGPYLSSGANTRLMSPYNTGNIADIVMANANLVANSFMLMAAATPGTACSQSELGKMLRDSTTTTSVVNLSALTCSYDTLNCSATSHYCYLPNARIANTQSLDTAASSYTCPAGDFIDNSLPIILTQGLAPSTSCTVAEVGPRVITPAGTIVTNGTNLIYTGITTTTKWAVLNSSANCVAGTLISGAANISRVACINYPEMIEAIESSTPPNLINYTVILASGETKCAGNRGKDCNTMDPAYAKVTLFLNLTKKLTLDNDGYLSCYDGGNNLLWQSPGGYTKAQPITYDLSFQRPQGPPLQRSTCYTEHMTFSDEATERQYISANFRNHGVAYFVFFTGGANSQHTYDPDCPANINKSQGYVPGPLSGTEAVSVLSMSTDGNLNRNHLWGHQGGARFPGDMCGNVGFSVGCINYYPPWDSGTSGNPGAFLIYNQDDNSIDIISADGQTIIKKLC